jgi:ribosomal protein L11 methyltransferase
VPISSDSEDAGSQDAQHLAGCPRFTYNLASKVQWQDGGWLVEEESLDEASWVGLRVRSPVDLQEVLVNFLVEQTDRGVQLEGEWITAFCRQGPETDSCIQGLSRYYKALRQIYSDLPELQMVLEDIETKNWGEAWKAFFKPVHIGKTIVVKPTWEPYQAIGRQVIIEIDPGRAFGTGKHPSTALCIEILEKFVGELGPSKVASDLSVLDVGTGTGILGIVAARLGMKRVLGLDVDPEALEAATHNLVLNRVAKTMVVSDTPLEQMVETFDLVVANLTAALIIQMSVPLVNRVADRGWLLLGGLLDEQVEGVIHSFQSHDFQLAESRSTEEWGAILLRRRGLGSKVEKLELAEDNTC